MNPIGTLSSVLGLAFASGVNLYAAVLVAGLGLRLGWIGGLPGDLSVLANPVILTIAGLMYLLEFFADKIPYVSIAWDTLHTVIRPLGGAALALASTAKLSPEVQALAMLTGGSIALGTHSTKMGYRLLAHASPEPVSDSIFSFAEDAGVVGLVLLIYKRPLVALCVVAALMAGMALVLPSIIRVLSFLCRGMVGRLVSWFPATGAANAVPAWVPDSTAQRVVRCFARKVPKAPWMREGYLLVPVAGQARFAWRGWFGCKVTAVPPPQTNPLRGLIFDQLGSADRPAWSVYITKDCSKEFQRASASAASATQGSAAV